VPAFVSRRATEAELKRFLLMISTATDGTGKNRNRLGATYPDYTLIEDATAEAFGGRTVKAKDVFDVFMPDDDGPALLYGISCKMKENDASCIARRRVYVEYANADSEFSRAVREAGHSKEQLIAKTAPADTCGQAVIEVARRWHQRAAEGHKGLQPGERIDIERSLHLVLSYTWNATTPSLFDYKLYVWPHLIPRVSIWDYSKSSLRGYENEKDAKANDPVYTYNYTSGGHVKWYPRANSAREVYGPFTLRKAPESTFSDVAKRYFPTEWPE
jgi:hypothetical protein